MKNTKEKLKNQSKVVKSSFPTEWHNATKFGVNQVLLAITLASISGINRIYRIAVFSGDGLVKALLKLDKAINENAISATLKNLGQSGAPKLQEFLLSKTPGGCVKADWRVLLWMLIPPSNLFVATRKVPQRDLTRQKEEPIAITRYWFS